METDRSLSGRLPLAETETMEREEAQHSIHRFHIFLSGLTPERKDDIFHLIFLFGKFHTYLGKRTLFAMKEPEDLLSFRAELRGILESIKERFMNLFEGSVYMVEDLDRKAAPLMSGDFTTENFESRKIELDETRGRIRMLLIGFLTVTLQDGDRNYAPVVCPDISEEMKQNQEFFRALLSLQESIERMKSGNAYFPMLITLFHGMKSTIHNRPAPENVFSMLRDFISKIQFIIEHHEHSFYYTELIVFRKVADLYIEKCRMLERHYQDLPGSLQHGRSQRTSPQTQSDIVNTCDAMIGLTKELAALTDAGISKEIPGAPKSDTFSNFILILLSSVKNRILALK